MTIRGKHIRYKPSQKQVKQALNWYKEMGIKEMAIKPTLDQSPQDVLDHIDEAVQHTENPQMPLQGLAVNPPVLPVTFKARSLNTVVDVSEPNITKEMLEKWSPLYVTAVTIIQTNKPKLGDKAFLFTFYIPGHPGKWCEFFGTQDEKRVAIYKAMQPVGGVMPDPIGPVWLRHTVTQTGNDYYNIVETPPSSARVTAMQAFPPVQDDIAF